MIEQPNPELYEQLAQPYSTRQDAADTLKAFLDCVAIARKNYRVPDVVICAAAMWQEGDTVQVERLALTLGDAVQSQSLAHSLLSAIVQSDKEDETV